jgi:phosphate/sulfate permease
MERLAHASLLWGVASGLLFAVLALAYRITTGVPVSVLVVLGVAVGVGAVTAGLSYLVEGRLR